MKRLYAVTVVLLAALVLGIAGCGGQQQDEKEQIKSLLNTSGYTSEEQENRYGSADSTLGDGGEGFLPIFTSYTRIPFVKFHRYVPRSGISRQVVVDIPAYPGWDDTTALATITIDINGELRTMFDTTTNPIAVWRKPFHDVAVRKVFLTYSHDRWHIRKVSPLRVATQDAPYEMNIVRLHAVGAVSGEDFDLTTTDTLLTKDELPTFVPGDTVTVTVTVQSAGDSCWVFLHRGKPPTWQRPWWWRQPYWKVSTYVFERTWVLGDENYDGPAIRPSAHDAIGWGTLWQDTTAHYVASAWGIPYIVKEPGDPIPPDE